MTVTAKVVVELEINCHSSWGDECTVSQVKKQALDSANGILNKALHKHRDITIKGTTKCISIIYHEN